MQLVQDNSKGAAMTEPTKSATEAQVCGATILGPRYGRNVVAWSKQCARKTTDPSGRCKDHQGRGPYGPGAR